MTDFFTKQFLLFLIIGGIATIVNFSSRILYNEWMSFSSAVIFAYFTGALAFFILAKLFVFKKSQRTIHQSASIFIIVNLISVTITWGISMLFISYVLPGLNVTKFSSEIAHLCGISASFMLSFILHKYWTFPEY